MSPPYRSNHAPPSRLGLDASSRRCSRATVVPSGVERRYGSPHLWGFEIRFRRPAFNTRTGNRRCSRWGMGTGLTSTGPMPALAYSRRIVRASASRRVPRRSGDVVSTSQKPSVRLGRRLQQLRSDPASTRRISAEAFALSVPMMDRQDRHRRVEGMASSNGSAFHARPAPPGQARGRTLSRIMVASEGSSAVTDRSGGS